MIPTKAKTLQLCVPDQAFADANNCLLSKVAKIKAEVLQIAVQTNYVAQGTTELKIDRILNKRSFEIRTVEFN